MILVVASSSSFGDMYRGIRDKVRDEFGEKMLARERARSDGEQLEGLTRARDA